MKLTPIRIRGKKARRPVGADGRASASPSPGPKQRRRRQRRVASPDDGPTTTPYVSFDQRLPLEVVESIYLLSQNVNLALCSRRLHWMLARRATRVEMALAAFAPAWDVDWARAPSAATEPAASSDVPGDPVFQTALLRCPWVDVPLLLDAEQLWMRRTFGRGGGGSGPDGGAVLAVPRKKHVVVRRSELAAAALASELGMDPEQATAVGQAHAAQGCADHHDYADGAEDEDGAGASTAATPLPSAHACFAYEALNATFNLSVWQEAVDGTPDAGHWLAEPLCPLAPCGAKHRTVHPRTAIPERLLLADGAPASSDAAAADREACRARLQRTYELLLWLVVGGARLQPTDSWEVTVDGHRRLLAAAAAADNPADADRAPDAGSALPLRLPLDVLCTSMLALYAELGVFADQWPVAVLREQLAAPPDTAATRASLCMRLLFGPAALPRSP